MVSVTACVLYPYDRRPSSLHIEFVHTGAYIFTRPLYPKIFPVVSQWMWLSASSNVIAYFWGSIRIS